MAAAVAQRIHQGATRSDSVGPRDSRLTRSTGISLRHITALIFVLLPAHAAAAQSGERPCPAGAVLRAAVQKSADASNRSAMPSSAVQVDTARQEIRILAGPFRIGAMSYASADMRMMQTPVLRIAWPVSGWLRGYRVQLCDGDAAPGTALPRAMVHHVGLANYSRRELLYLMVERLIASGKETDGVLLPGNVGAPLERGDTLGLYAAFHDVDGQSVNRAYVILTLPWIPAGHGHPINVLPFFVEVNCTIGGTSAYDLPPGRSEQSAEFTMPLSGSILAIGGHMHDYALSVRLEDAESGKTLVKLKAKSATNGQIITLGRRVFGFHEEGLPLLAHHRYRVVAEYFNPTSHVLRQGGMGMMAGAFIPEDLRQWPRLDSSNADVQRDIASIGNHDMVQ